MTYVKDSIYNTSLPILIMDDSKQYTKYPIIGGGEEGIVFKFNDARAVKVFDPFIKKEKLTSKFEKIEELGRIKDKNFCFPQGLVGYLNLKKEGYYMSLVKPLDKCKDFSELDKLKDIKKMLEYVLIADKAIQRIHKRGIVLGDIRADHIMIDKYGEVKFVDTDNYHYLDYDYDLDPCRCKWFKYIYNKNISGKDNDIFVFTIMVLNCLLKGSSIKFVRDDKFFKQFINSLNIDSEVKDGLRIILSDADNKPYAGKILKKINCDEDVIAREGIIKLNNV